MKFHVSRLVISACVVVAALNLAGCSSHSVPSTDDPSKASAFPPSLALAARFSTQMAYRVGKTIVIDVPFNGNDLLHVPKADVLRVARGVGSLETYGEAPFLANRSVPNLRPVPRAAEGMRIRLATFSAGNHKTLVS